VTNRLNKREIIVNQRRCAGVNTWAGWVGTRSTTQVGKSLNAERSAAGLAGAGRDPSAPSGPAMRPRADESPKAAATLTNLPAPDTKRWVVRRKAAVVAAVRTGGITIADACRLYQLSEEEFLSWERAFEIYGLAGLRTTRVQQYRRAAGARQRSQALPKRRPRLTPFP
jgi:hypothetical protein